MVDPEGNEAFQIQLANPTGALLASPSTANVVIADNDVGNGPNPIDNAGAFVRQHYIDFLNREPDQSGLDFWTNQITSCGNDAACTEVRRINVSAAFFLSIEFQQTGYLVERMYKTAYGDANGTSTLGGSHQLAVPVVRFNEFLTDTQRIGQGVVVLAPGWEQALENNKQAYAGEFVATSRFTTAFPTTMTPAQFVDKLNQNAGNVLSLSERTTAINLFSGAADSSNATARAQALRQVAEDQDLFSAEFNRAFVLTEFFGYLRRNPNDLPDSDYTGYEFWLNKLNQFNGDYISAELVKAFIASSEYRPTVWTVRPPVGVQWRAQLMPIDRRKFLRLAALASGTLGLGSISRASVEGVTRFSSHPQSVKPLRILILGGTGFTGPFQVKYALSRGHQVTVFNRGRTHPGELPKEVEQLIGDRNGQLDALKGSGML